MMPRPNRTSGYSGGTQNELSESDTSDDSGSDWEESFAASSALCTNDEILNTYNSIFSSTERKARGEVPPAKRIKLASSAAGNVSRERKIPNLRAFLDMPLDVL